MSRIGTCLAGALAVAALAVAPAAANPATAQKPRTGHYEGFVRIGGLREATEGKLYERGSKQFVELAVGNRVALACPGHIDAYLPLKATAPVKGGSFKVTTKIPHPAEIPNRTATVTMTGHFVGPAEMVGTVSAKTVVEAGVEGSQACTSGSDKFQLRRG